jgi:hypothetical protein
MTTKREKQLMVVWHINNLMASCGEDIELTKFSCYLAKTYQPKLSMHTGSKHNYLSVDMEFNSDGTLDVSMIKCLQKVIEEFLELITGKAATPSADHLFNTRDE